MAGKGGKRNERMEGVREGKVGGWLEEWCECWVEREREEWSEGGMQGKGKMYGVSGVGERMKRLSGVSGENGGNEEVVGVGG